jgi:hypothetical protein
MPLAGVLTIGIFALGAIVSLAIALFHKSPEAPPPKFKQLDLDFDVNKTKRH